MTTRTRVRWILLPLCVLAVATQARAQTSGTFETLTYNVAGLLEPFSGSDPAVNTPIISCLIRDYDVVQVQEDFNYHAALYDSCDNHLFRSATSGGMGFGSGLNTLSNFTYMDFGRITWNHCDGVDCLTPKGLHPGAPAAGPGRLRRSLQPPRPGRDHRCRPGRAPRQHLPPRRVHREQLRGQRGDRYGRHQHPLHPHRRQHPRAREARLQGRLDRRAARGQLPGPRRGRLMGCEPSATNANCEVVDKVFYRTNGYLGLDALQYLVEDQRFLNASGADLSDHWPVQVKWSWGLPSNRRLSDQWGGPHGVNFNDLALLPTNPVVSRLNIRSGARVDLVATTLSNGYVLSHGGGGGTLRSLTLASGEYLRSLFVCSGSYNGLTRIFHVRFTTSTNRTLAGGNTTGSCTTYTAPTNWQIVGFHGRSGDDVDKLGVIYTPRLSGTPPAPPQYFSSVNRASGLCMEIFNFVMASGTNVAQWTCNGGNWQKWNYDATTGLIRSQRDPRFCLDNSGSFDDGANIIIWTCNGNAHQRFDLNTSSGVISMRTHPTQVVDGVGTAAGGDIITFSNWGGTNQRWNFVP